jgi:benzoate membrane transport protein
VRDLHAASVWAGITAVAWYVFGAVPLQIGVAAQLGLDPAQTSSWIFVVWSTSAASSVALSLIFRQPLPITWSIPGLVYLGTLAGHFTFPEIVGANLVAGLLIVAVGLLGIGGRILAWLPLPVAMGMFAGSILGDVINLVSATIDDTLIAGAAVVGYAAGRLVAIPRLPPLGLAALFGGLAVTLTHQLQPAAIAWSPPVLVAPQVTLSLPAIVAVSLPMVVLTIGLGNVQGLGFLLSQGYRTPVNLVTVVVGINSVFNALLGGHPAIVARTGVSILAGPDAGPAAGRYWGSVIAASLTLLIAVAASPLAALLDALPHPYVVTLAGLAILSSFQDALRKGFGGPLRFGATVAFVLSATPFAVAGVSSAFWALLAGLVASLVVERDDLLAHWRESPERERRLAENFSQPSTNLRSV